MTKDIIREHLIRQNELWLVVLGLYIIMLLICFLSAYWLCKEQLKKANNELPFILDLDYKSIDS